jgi:TolB-like protein
MLIMACATNTRTSTNDEVTLDKALKEAAIQIDERIEAGVKIALINFSSPSNKFSSYVLDELTANLVDSGKLTVVDRNETDLIRKEFDFQLSGDVSDDSMQSLGRMLGAQSIVSGSLTAIGRSYRIIIRVLNVETAAVAVQYRTDIANDKRVQDLLDGTTPTATGTQAAPSNRTYNVGEIGPARGIIFYDKKVFSNGWRYLEAAPAEYEMNAQWGLFGVDVSGTSTELGRGKANTEIIVTRIKQHGELDRAAELCTALDINGYKDWFLPSKDELNLMYQNLKQKRLGGFDNGWYWSSSQANHYNAWNQNFSDGDQLDYYKNNAYTVRAIRAF